MVAACYLDASIILSALITTDSRHQASVETLEKLREQGWELITSTYAFTEIVNTTCRRAVRGEWHFAAPLAKLVNQLKALSPQALCEALAPMLSSFLEELHGVKVIEDPEFYSIESVDTARIARLFREAINLAWVDIRTKDLLHIAAASLMRKRGVKRILTADVEDFENIKDKLERELGLEVELVHPP
ncbi:MAG: PIN domain-containing protein [Thermofilum sp.]|nr:PIN domain-containing protein [Thermofilum sp.]